MRTRTKEEIREYATKIALELERPASGKERRYALLAYAYVRGRPYRASELRTWPHNRPSPTRLSEILDAPVEYIKAWLAVPPTPVMLAKDDVARGLQILEKDRQRKERKRRLARLEWLVAAAVELEIEVTPEALRDDPGCGSLVAALYRQKKREEAHS